MLPVPSLADSLCLPRPVSVFLPPHPLLIPIPFRFRSKYHPDEAGRRKQEAHNALQNRLNVVLYLMENGWLDNLQLDIDKANAIIKVLDAGGLASLAFQGRVGCSWAMIHQKLRGFVLGSVGPNKEGPLSHSGLLPNSRPQSFGKLTTCSKSII